MEENNILIAEFLGFKEAFVRNHNGIKYDYDLLDSFELIKEVETTVESVWCEVLEYQDRCMKEELKFHSDWNWLMQVVEKIESLEDYRFNFEIIQGCARIYDTQNFEYLINVDYCIEKIESVYKAVIEFIKWYNSAKKQK